MLLLDVTIVNVALPSIQTSLKANFSDLQWVVDAYSLALAALLLTTGSLADLWGRRLIFVLGLVVFTGSSLASGLAQSPVWLNVARGAQGVGASAMFSTGLALLGSSFQGRERGVAFGVWGAITGLAVAVGPVIGGGLTTGISWRWIFLVNVPIGVIAVIISLLRVQESKMAHARRPDPIGVVTFSGALAALVYALIKGDQMGWSNEVIRGCLIAAGVLLVVFLIAERIQRDRAMFDLSLFRKPTFTGGAIAAFGLSGGLFALFLYLTLYLQDVLGFSALQTGLRFLVMSGGMLLTSALAGRLTAVVPIRLLISPGLVMVGAGLFLMRGIDVSTGWTHLIPGFVLTGAGTGLINPPLASTAIGVVRPERAGMASGINSTFRQVGIATGIAGLGAIFSHQVRATIESLLRGSSQVSAAQAHTLAAGVASGGGVRSGIEALHGPARGVAVHALRASFASGLNEIFLVGGILSLASAVLTLILIRSKDFEIGAARTVSPPRTADLADAVAGEPEPQVSGPAQPAEVKTPVAPGPDARVSNQNGAHLQVEGPPADIQPDEQPGLEAADVSDHSTAADESAAYSAGPESPALHHRMSGYGYQSPLPPPPPPPPLATPAPEVEAATDRESPAIYGSAQASPDPEPKRYRGYQSPSEAWKAASQAWQTLSGPEGSPAEVEQSPPDVQQSLSEIEQLRSEIELVRSQVEDTPSVVEDAHPEVEQSVSEAEEPVTEESEADVAGAEVEQTSSDAEHSEPRSTAVPAARGFWSRFSAASSYEAAETHATETDPGATAPAEVTTEREPEPELEPEPGPALAAAEAFQPEPETDPEPEPVWEPEPEAEAPAADIAVAEAEAPAADTAAAEPEAPAADTAAAEPGAAADIAVAEPEAPAEASFSYAVPPTPEPDERSDLPSGQDVPMSTSSPGTPPAMRDVRLVAQAIQSAEEAALAYAREIGEARRHLAAAIEHLDRADEARALLNRHAAGFSAQAPGDPGSSAPAGAASSASGTRGATTAPEHVAPAVSRPSPGIAIATPSGPVTGPRGSAADGDTEANEPSGSPSAQPASGRPGDPVAPAEPHGSAGGPQLSSVPNPPVPPPPRPGGWGPGTGGAA